MNYVIYLRPSFIISMSQEDARLKVETVKEWTCHVDTVLFRFVESLYLLINCVAFSYARLFRYSIMKWNINNANWTFTYDHFEISALFRKLIDGWLVCKSIKRR